MVNQNFIKDIKTGMNIVDGDEYKDILEAITDITCDIVVKTLGPYAATTVIDDGVSTYSTKDGWSVVNRIHFGDSIENTLYKFIKDISFTLNSRVGDGTTTAIVTAKMFINIFRGWLEKQRNDPNSEFKYIRQNDLLNEVNKAANLICEELKNPDRLKQITKTDEIYKIANISTNGNEEIAKIIKDIYDKTNNPNIHVTLNVGGETYAEIQDGYKLDTVLLNPSCHFNTSENTCVLSGKTDIVIFDHNVTYVDHYSIVNSLITGYCNAKGHNLVVMAPYFDDMFTSVASAQIRQIVHAGQISPLILVQIPTANTLQKCMISDFACLCETEIFTYSKVRMFNQMQASLSGESTEFDEYAKLIEVSGFKTPESILECSIGTAKRLTIGKNFTLLQGFNKNTTMYKNTLKLIQEAYDAEKNKANATNNRLTLSYADTHMRLIKFEGKSGTIYVGGESELSCKCLKDAVDDAVLACRSAYENGYIRGMNIETISAIDTLIKSHADEKLTSECLKMIGRAFIQVTTEIMYNKYRSEGFSKDEFKKLSWGTEYKSSNVKNTTKVNKDIAASNSFKNLEQNGEYPAFIINTCVELGLEYNLVTEKFGPAGYSVINSVSTDIEIIKATTNILSLLLSSNQLVSINKMYDKKLSTEEAVRKEKERATNVANGYLNAIAGSDAFTSLVKAIGQGNRTIALNNGAKVLEDIGK